MLESYLSVWGYFTQQGCQLPDLSLRNQTFCYIAEFSTFLFMLKTKTFLHIPSPQKFWLYFAKDYCDSRQKREKRPHLAGFSCARAGLWPAVTHMLSTSRSFQTFLKHNVGNLVTQIYQSILDLAHSTVPRWKRYC